MQSAILAGSIILIAALRIIYSNPPSIADCRLCLVWWRLTPLSDNPVSIVFTFSMSMFCILCCNVMQTASHHRCPLADSIDNICLHYVCWGGNTDDPLTVPRVVGSEDVTWGSSGMSMSWFFLLVFLRHNECLLGNKNARNNRQLWEFWMQIIEEACSWFISRAKIFGEGALTPRAPLSQERPKFPIPIPTIFGAVMKYFVAGCWEVRLRDDRSGDPAGRYASVGKRQ